MKKFVVFMFAALAIFTIALPFVFGQEEDIIHSHVRGRGPMPPQMISEREGAPVTPQELAGFNDKTRAAWLEIENYKLKKGSHKYTAIAAALTIGLAAIGGAFAQGRAAVAALDGIARNPEASSKIFTPLIISLALIESLVIYALVIALILQGKI